MLLLKISVLPVFVNSLPMAKDHYAQRTGQNLQERGINFFFPRGYKEKMQLLLLMYTLPASLRTANAVIIINVTIRYVLPTRLQIYKEKMQ